MSSVKEKPTLLTTVAGEIEAQQLRSFLEAYDIPCFFHGEALRKTHGLTLDGLGEVKIHVPEEFVEKARELLARAESGELSLGEDDAGVDEDSPSTE